MLFFYNSGCVLFIPHCHMNITVCFFYNSGWVLFILDGDLAITVSFFYNSRWVLFIPGCHLAIAVYFFTTVDGCCLFLLVIWTSLCIFLQIWMGAVYS